jgi:hypothetical protein
MTSDQLRQTAQLLRKTASEMEVETMTKCAKVLQAATALALLRKKVTPHGP